MKILLVALALFTLGAHAQIKAPTIYGKVNKMVRYIDQDVAGQDAFAGLEEGARPTRFGITGDLNTANTKVKYILETQFNSESGSGSLAMRRAVINFDWGFGTFKFGQEWTAASLLWLDVDPLNHTGAGLLGTGIESDIEGASRFVGYYSRLRKDMIGYVSPEYMGFQIAVSYDRDDNNARTGAIDNGMDVALTYKLNMGSIKGKAFVGYTTVHGGTAQKDDSMMGGASVSMGDLKIAGMYTVKKDQGNGTGAAEVDTNLMTISAAYKIGSSTVAVTYGGKDDDTDKLNMTTVGYMYDVNKHVQLNATASLIKSEGTTDNDATMIGVGTWLQF